MAAAEPVVLVRMLLLGDGVAGTRSRVFYTVCTTAVWVGGWTCSEHRRGPDDGRQTRAALCRVQRADGPGRARRSGHAAATLHKRFGFAMPWALWRQKSADAVAAVMCDGVILTLANTLFGNDCSNECSSS
eukprot:TRINITY_DN6061_c0_g1_i1.p1 TRINITY_DN6061_c0_g1~~TRINITY_DN6061_c0_g1_i1.p1  ORF type:complete len:131 (+),score=10.40 TRINITY_DN6061_c0_g1_i1:1-393(+)